jgi:hypothetical protein
VPGPGEALAVAMPSGPSNPVISAAFTVAPAVVYREVRPNQGRRLRTSEIEERPHRCEESSTDRLAGAFAPPMKSESRKSEPEKGEAAGFGNWRRGCGDYGNGPCAVQPTD